MSCESKSGGRVHRLDTPGVFLGDSGGWRVTLGNFNSQWKMSSGWQLFPAKIFLKWWILLDKSFATNDCLDVAFVRSTRSFTSLPGGNKVDGLPPESSLELLTKISDVGLFFFVAELHFSKPTDLFQEVIVFTNTYDYCASAREGFIEFGGQDVENLRSEFF